MGKVIQIRDIPDDVHALLVDAARARGLSLTGYLRSELDHLAHLAEITDHNHQVIQTTRRSIGTRVDRAEIVDALDAARDR